MQPLVVFSHGKESGPWGGKIRHLAACAETAGCRVLSLDYTDLDNPDARVERLVQWPLGSYTRLVLVGSSMGGYVSLGASASLQPDGLFLLAPALSLPGYAQQQPKAVAAHTSLVCGWQDDVIPLSHVLRFAVETQADTHILPDGHRLLAVLPQIGDLFTLFLQKVLS